MSRQILVQRLLLPSNGNVSSTSSRTIYNNVTPEMTTDTSSKNAGHVAWHASSCKLTTTDSELPSSDTTDSQDLSTFLNSLSSEVTTPVTEPQTLNYPQQQYISDHLRNKNEQGPSSVDSIDSAFDESSSKF